MPDWLASDWPLVGLSLLVLFGVIAAASAVLGALLGLVTEGPGALPGGAIVGLYLSFVAFGVETVVRSGDSPGFVLGMQFLPLPWAVLPGVGAWMALRYALPRLASDRATVIAFAAKLAVTAGILAAVAASVLSIGSEDDGRGEIFARVSGGEAWLYTTLLVGSSLAVLLHLEGIRLLPRFDPRRLAAAPTARHALEGAKAFALLAAGMGVVAMVAAIVVVDSGAERLGLVASIPFLGVTAGVVGASFAMGAAVNLSFDHTSLLNFGFPPGPDAGAAPIPFFLLLGAAPALVGWLTWRRLASDQPRAEQDVMKVGFTTAIAFTLTAWVAALVSQVALAAAVFGDSDAVGAFLEARPSLGGVLGLALLAGLAGGLGASFAWSRQRGLSWSGQARSAPPAAAPPDAATIPCPSCGGSQAPGARFCSDCGAPLP